MLELVLVCTALLVNAPADEHPTRAQLDAAIAKARSEPTRLAGIGELLRLAKFGVRQVGSSVLVPIGPPELRAIGDDASAALKALESPETAQLALESADPEVRLWAVFAGRKTLGPRLHAHLGDPDERVRSILVDLVPLSPAERAAMAHSETEPGVLLHLTGSGHNPAFYAELCRLLKSPDDPIRNATLVFIWGNLWNDHTADIWRLGFDPAVRAAVEALTHASQADERDAARRALEQLDAVDVGGPPDLVEKTVDGVRFKYQPGRDLRHRLVEFPGQTYKMMPGKKWAIGLPGDRIEADGLQLTIHGIRVEFD